MGLLSKLFGKADVSKKTGTEKEKTINEVQMPVQIRWNNERTVPNFKGDYAQVGFLVTYAKASEIKPNNKYKDFIVYELGINQPALFHKKMIDEGFLQQANIEEELNTLKINELKQILDEIGQPKTGNKSTLIARVMESTNAENLVMHLPKKTYYVISQKGKEYLNAHSEIVDLFQNRDRYNVTYEEYIAARAENPRASYHDLIWGEFQRKRMECFKRGNLDTNGEINMYNLLLDEKRYADALFHAIKFFYSEVNAVQKTYDYIKFYQKKTGEKEQVANIDFMPKVFLSPFGLKMIEELKDYYQDSIIDRVWADSEIHYCSKQEFVNMVHEVLEGHLDYSATEKELSAKVPVVLSNYI